MAGDAEDVGWSGGLQGVKEVIEESAVKAGGGQLAVAFGKLEDAVDGTEMVAAEVVAYAVEFVGGDAFVAEAADLGVDLYERVGGGIGSHVGGDVKDDAAAENLDAAVDAVGVAFVLAEVAHEAGAEIAAKQGVEDHESVAVGVVPTEREDAADAEGGLGGGGKGDGHGGRRDRGEAV